MKTVIVSALLAFFGAAAVAQENPPAEPAKPAVATPAAPAQPAVETPAQPAVETPAKPAVETPAEPAQPVVETPAKPAVETPAAVPQPEVKAAPVWNNLPELKKSQGQAVADLKKKQEEAVKQLKASMKGKPIPEIRAAVEKQRSNDKVALKLLKDAQNAEIEQFKKDHPEAAKKIQEVKKPEIKTPAVPEKK